MNKSLLLAAVVLSISLYTFGCRKDHPADAATGAIQPAAMSTPVWTPEQVTSAQGSCQSNKGDLAESSDESVKAVCSCLIANASSRWAYADWVDHRADRTKAQQDDGTFANCKQNIDKTIAAKVLPYEGKWRTDCINFGDDTSGRKQLEITETSYQVKYFQYGTDDCDEVQFVESQQFSLALVGQTEDEFNVNMARQHAFKKFTSPLSLLLARIFGNYSNYSWVIWRDSEITDKQPEPGELPDLPANERIFNLIRVVGDSLYLGDRDGANDGKTAETRPKTVHEAVAYRRYTTENHPPKIDVYNSTVTAEVGADSSFFFYFFDEDGDDLDVTCISGCTSEIAFEHFRIGFRPTALGSTEVKFKVTDTHGAAAVGEVMFVAQ